MTTETRPPTEHVAEDAARDMTIEEIAQTWVELDEQAHQLLQARDVLSQQLLEYHRDEEAREVVIGEYLSKLWERYGDYQWDMEILEREARPLLTPKEWEKAIKVQEVPAHTKTTVVTQSLKSALAKKGERGRAILERASNRKLESAGVKVERL